MYSGGGVQGVAMFRRGGVRQWLNGYLDTSNRNGAMLQKL